MTCSFHNMMNPSRNGMSCNMPCFHGHNNIETDVALWAASVFFIIPKLVIRVAIMVLAGLIGLLISVSALIPVGLVLIILPLIIPAALSMTPEERRVGFRISQTLSA